MIYFGDGAGDFCPCSRLDQGSKACARVGYSLLEKLRALEQSPEGLKCDIVEWADLDEQADVLE